MDVVCSWAQISPNLSVNTKRKMYHRKRKWSLTWYVTYQHPVAFKMVVFLFVVSSATVTWLLILYRADGIDEESLQGSGNGE